MGLFGNLFSKKEMKLRDTDLGEFVKISQNKSGIVWKREIDFLGTQSSLFILGNETELDQEQRQVMLEVLNYSDRFIVESDNILREQFANAERSYSKWSDHFKCLSISTADGELQICFGELESLYHFNIFFEGSKAVDVSIDS